MFPQGCIASTLRGNHGFHWGVRAFRYSPKTSGKFLYRLVPRNTDVRTDLAGGRLSGAKSLGREVASLIVASLDRKRLGQDRRQGQKTGSEAFSIRRLGGRRWRGGRGSMGFECAPGVRLRDGRAGWKCESSLVIMGQAANGWNGKLEKGQSRQGGDTRASACWRTSKRRYRRSC